MRPSPPEPDTPNTGRVHSFPERPFVLPTAVAPDPVVVEVEKVVQVEKVVPRYKPFAVGGAVVFVVVTLLERLF